MRLLKCPKGRSTDEHIDKTIVKELVSDEDALFAKEEKKTLKKQRRAELKVRERLKAERRLSGGREAVDDEEEDIDKFAKGLMTKSKKR